MLSSTGIALRFPAPAPNSGSRACSRSGSASCGPSPGWRTPRLVELGRSLPRWRAHRPRNEFSHAAFRVDGVGWTARSGPSDRYGLVVIAGTTPG
jgi:hypothetical protein